jgi:cyclophilin family peptidyl-prolyl cis-trans isomerase
VGTAKRARQDANRALKQQQQAKQDRRDKVVTSGRRILVYAAVVAAVLALVLFLLSSRDDGGGRDDEDAASTTVAGDTSTTVDPFAFVYGTTPCPAAEGSAEPQREFEDSFEQCIDSSRTYAARITTSVGDIVVTLDPATAPGGVNNFVALARSGFYDGLTIHRVQRDWYFQAGDPNGDGTGGPGYTIAEEVPADGNAAYSDGSVLLANRGFNTTGSNFIVVFGTWPADVGATYTKIGEVSGSGDTGETVDAIAALAPDSGDGPPSEAVTVTAVEITEG